MYKKIKPFAVFFTVGGLLVSGLLINGQKAFAPSAELAVKKENKVAKTQKSQQPPEGTPLPGLPKTTPLMTSLQTNSFAKTSVMYPERKISDSTFAVGNKLYPLRKYKALISPNDTSAAQWWVTQTGLPGSWDYGTGINTKIAIIDTGFALQHEEFAGRWLDNNGESGSTANENPTLPNCSSRGLAINKSCNAIDDDNNGFVDDFRGWDFESDDASPQAGEVNSTGSAVSHGSSVAGVAAATGNNSTGIAGVSWGAKILPLQALSDNGTGDTLGIARAIRYAADRGVDVINLSLGSNEEDSYMRQAVQYALERGVIVVAAAGNDGCNCMSYPAQYPEVVAVGASSPNGAVTSFSSYGDTLDIVAPGSGIKAPAWSSASPTNSYAQNLAGTSFSSPFISGLLANARAKQPNATWGQLLNAMLQSADHRGQTPAAPRSNTAGFGFVKADTFMARLSNPHNQLIRYSFGLNSADALGSPTAMDCGTSLFPSAPFYSIKNGNTAYYTVSELTAVIQRNNGASVSQKGYVCTGLPTDQVSISRRIDPLRELSNDTTKY